MMRFIVLMIALMGLTFIFCTAKTLRQNQRMVTQIQPAIILRVQIIMRKIILFSFVVFIALSLSCQKDNPINGGKPPCLDCPVDFRLTD